MNKFWNFKNQADDPSVGELTIFGPIASQSLFGDEITPKTFKEDLDALGNISVLNVSINSGGGSAFAGQAIHSILRRHSAHVNVHIDGLAASAAAVIAVAGDTVIMPNNSLMMIHNASAFAGGDANDFRKIAALLDKSNDTIVAAFQHKTNLDADKIADLMTEETWMTAAEAVELGFADEVEELEVAASVSGDILTMNGIEMDMSDYSHFDKVAASLDEGTNNPVHKIGDIDMTTDTYTSKTLDKDVYGETELSGLKCLAAKIQRQKDRSFP